MLGLGAGWRSDVRRPDEGSDEQWFVHGVPPQVAVGRVGPDCVLVRPRPSWSGVAHLVWHFEDRQPFDAADLLHRPEAVAEAADDLAVRRRRTFRWCRTCRELQAPEAFVRDEGVCMGCAARHHGYVF